MRVGVPGSGPMKEDETYLRALQSSRAVKYLQKNVNFSRRIASEMSFRSYSRVSSDKAPSILVIFT